MGLNEELLFHFSEDLDRASVTSESVSILDGLGRPAAGRRVVRGKALSFVPDLPRSPDLSDGGLRPGTSYSVVLGGFPRLDGIRSRTGALLSATLQLSFRTAEAGGAQPLFLDPFEGPNPLRPSGEMGPKSVVASGGRITLECGEALDPRSLAAEDFEVSRYPPNASREEELERVPVRVRLSENDRHLAVLVVEPEDRAGFEPGEYYLRLIGRRLLTLGGRSVETGWPNLLSITVPPLRFELDFRRARERRADSPNDGGAWRRGRDGTAAWDERGVSVRYPAAAGSGNAGPIELRAPPAGRDLHATRVLVPAGADVNLDGWVGPVVLRAQTAFEISGRLLRRGASFEADNPLSEELLRTARTPGATLGDLSAWVEKVLAPDQPWSREPWTILIAGGDLFVPKGGAIEVSGPLVLVAGGWIRVEGDVRAWEVWKTSPSGENVAGRSRVPQNLPLELDPPALNLLREPLRVGLRTRPQRLARGVERWRTVLERGGGGELDLGFLVERRAGPVGREVLLLDPAQLGAAEFRVFVELVVPPGHGEPWDPPRLERLVLEPLASEESAEQAEIER